MENTFDTLAEFASYAYSVRKKKNHLLVNKKIVGNTVKLVCKVYKIRFENGEKTNQRYDLEQLRDASKNFTC